MRSQRKPDPGRPFTREEEAELALYLKTDCEPDKHSASNLDSTTIDRGGIGDTLGCEYSKYVELFIKILNRRSIGYRKPRLIVRKLWKSKALPKCQVIAMCNYVVLCASTHDDEKRAKSFIDRRFTAAKNVKSTIEHLIKLRKAVEEEECSAAHYYGFPELNKELRSILELMSACMVAIQEVQAIRKSTFSLPRVLSSHALLKRKHRSQFLHPPHPQGGRANAAEAEEILPILHEAITGTTPNHEVETDYIAVNMGRDARRLTEDATIARIDTMIEKLDKIIPGFIERIDTEDLKNMDKSPTQVQLPPNAEEILWLVDLHTAYTNSKY